MDDFDALPQPAPLLIAHARARDREWHRLCWTIDDRMARIALGAKEGAVAAIRLAWWEEALTSDGTKGRGEPTLEKWHGMKPGIQDKAWINAIAGAWRMLLDPQEMSEGDWRAFGNGRGAIFPLIARGGDPDKLTRAGALWALWDVARRDVDRQRAEGAFAGAIAVLEEEAVPRIAPAPLALAAAMAADDARDRTMPEPGLTPRQYLRLVRRSIFG